jgi:transposase
LLCLRAMPKTRTRLRVAPRDGAVCDSACEVNPFKLRQFAKASGILAKSDPLDARVIASFIAIMPTPTGAVEPPTIERLAEMLAVRRQFNAKKVATENAARLLEDAMLQRLSRRRVARLAADNDMLDRHLVEMVKTDATFAHRYRLLTSMPGVGLVLACTLMAPLPEFGTLSRKQVATLVGVAPYAFESGKFKGLRCIGGGRAPVREALYMAAMSAGNWNPVLKAFRKRLKDAGKMAKVVIVAVMRKMISMLTSFGPTTFTVKITVAHSITSSASANRLLGTSRPSSLAVFRLMTKLNFEDLLTGRLAGVAPSRI